MTKKELNTIITILNTEIAQSKTDKEDNTEVAEHYVLLFAGFVRGYCYAKGVTDETEIQKVADEIQNHIMNKQ